MKLRITLALAVAAMEGDLLVATVIDKGHKSVSLRDSRGRQAW
jgi:hypothetical protein